MDDISELNADSCNFYSCKFRSDSTVDRLIKRCNCRGGNYTLSEYYCEKKEIFGVNEGICKACDQYESK